ncbi:HlyD family efflux transporter periplasmic adaptor subunit [Clostridium tarantellae]|uniref:HlyD family efflux transporter periplasmic adaptor subunit n=1 Tax=Clostridium tarantellae TaxID=39493 RepID=A0A6I1MJB5_9CLOT|nr:HlyD family efflux transporter periplasmic adaptor subunit [Clostridium tarantellae]MPQ43626.1 HlyD family efflux transporter periplasmic adaptor subunit [Clostridium tarantellae]
MKLKIVDINDITDGREIMESKPHAFTLIFMYILIALISAFLMWSWFSEKEIIVKVSGIVRPSDKIFAISNEVPGTIKEIKFKNGEKVSKGDVLYSITSPELMDKKKQLDNSLNTLNADVDNLNKLSKSVKDDTNYFNKDNESEKSYYYKFQSYKASNKTNSVDIEALNGNKNSINGKINSLNSLINSVNNNTDYTEKNTIYSSQFEAFKLSQKEIDTKISELNSLYNASKNKGASQEELNSIKEQIDNSNTLIKKNKADFIIKVQSSINELNNELNNIDTNLNKINEDGKLSLDKNKNTILCQIEDGIKGDKEKITEINTALESINNNINNCEVKANTDGILDMKAQLEPGMMIQPGAMVGNIIPDNNSYNIDLMIPDKDIGTIKTGQSVKYSFPSLPYQEYGFLEGLVSNLSADSNMDTKNGLAFYTGVGTVSKDSLSSHKGEENKIKAGMTCEARIVTRKEKMLFYFLEKLGLKD